MMIIVPVVIAVAVGCGCVGLVFEVIKHGTSYGLDKSGEFYLASQAAAEMAEHTLQGTDQEGKYGKDGKAKQGKNALEKLLDTSLMRLEIHHGDSVIYAYGQKDSRDNRLIQSAMSLGEDGAVAQISGRRIFCKLFETNGTSYQIYVLGTKSEDMGTNLKVVIALSAGVLILSILLAVWGTNKVLTKFVFRRIEEPLDILTTGVQEIGKGNLDYRIDYKRKDEFLSACDAFNEMAVRLKTSVEQTQKNEESRKELMAGISHDLRSPLTSIKAYVEGLLDGIAETPEARTRYLLTIQRKAEDIDRMVNQIFTFSKLELDEYPMEIRTVALDQEIRQIIKESSAEYEKKGLQISCDKMDACKAAIDRDQFHRVLSNIMDNSAKYKADTIGHLRISLEKQESKAVITLKDDGKGVAPEALPKLFDAFYRTDPARKNPAGGSGLGLAIAAKTMERMHGSIHAENAPDGGLCMILTLPLKEGE